jgi:hypothetical protein
VGIGDGALGGGVVDLDHPVVDDCVRWHAQAACCAEIAVVAGVQFQGSNLSKLMNRVIGDAGEDGGS